jgi:hypothetical protein
MIPLDLLPADPSPVRAHAPAPLVSRAPAGAASARAEAGGRQ